MRTLNSATMLVLTALSALTLPACAVASEPAPVAAVETESVGQLGEELRDRLTPRLTELGTPSLESLEALYASGTADGPMPEGRAVGRALFLGLPGLTNLEEHLRRAGWPTARTVEDFIANVVWRGKTFRPLATPSGDKIGTLTNDVLGFDIATADILHIGESPVAEEANTFYLDYSQSNFFLVRGVQDYIRQIEPGLYIGKAFLKLPGGQERFLACYFALDFAK